MTGGTPTISQRQADGVTYVPVASATTDASGNWTSELPAGDYRVSCDANPKFLASNGGRYDLSGSEYGFIVSPAQ